MTNAEKQAFREAVIRTSELAVLLGSDANDGSAIELDQTLWDASPDGSHAAPRDRSV